MDNKEISTTQNTGESADSHVVLDITGRLNRIHMMFPGCFVAEFLVANDADLPRIIRIIDDEYNIVYSCTTEIGNSKVIHCSLPGKYAIYQSTKSPEGMTLNDCGRTLDAAIKDMHPCSGGRDDDYFIDDNYLDDMMKYFPPEEIPEEHPYE